MLKRKIDEYSSLSDDEWNIISAKTSCKKLKKNELLVANGEVCKSIWFVTKGLIRYYRKDVNTTERTTCFVMENHFSTPFASYLQESPSNETLIAMEESEVVEISKKDFLQFLEAISSISVMYRKILEESYLQMENLSYSLQHRTALERYKKLILDTPELLKRVPLTYIASYLGISPETLSRIRAKI